MTAEVKPAKTSLPRMRWLAFLDCAAADEESVRANLPLALNEDIKVRTAVTLTTVVAVDGLPYGTKGAEREPFVQHRLLSKLHVARDLL